MSTTNRTQGSLYTKIEQGIAYLEFGHPASNSFPSQLLDRLAKQLGEIGLNPDVKVVVLRSEGPKAFCAGASFDELLAISNPQEGTAFFSGFARVLQAMRACPQPIVGRIQGKAVGGGVGLIAACDYVFATEAASVKLSEIAIGIAPLVIAPAVQRKIGAAGMATLSLDPKHWQNAYWAKEHGLYQRVFENTSEMDQALEAYLFELSSFSGEALKRLKQALWYSTESWDPLMFERASQSGQLALGEEARKALEGFRKKE
jgi:methylglutaconyl-CoA hydratase